MVSGLNNDRRDPNTKLYYPIFEKLCPEYMAMGMSYYDFWYGEADIAMYTRRAYELKLKHENTSRWQNAAYVFRAVVDASGAFNWFGKRDAKFSMKEPFPLSAAEQRERDKRDERLRYEETKARFLNRVKELNARRKTGSK